MARIPQEEMKKRVSAIQDLLETNVEGLSIKELVDGLKAKGVALPPSAYQGVNVVLKAAAKMGYAMKEGSKWKLCDEQVTPVVPQEESGDLDKN